MVRGLSDVRRDAPRSASARGRPPGVRPADSYATTVESTALHTHPRFRNAHRTRTPNGTADEPAAALSTKWDEVGVFGWDTYSSADATTSHFHADGGAPGAVLRLRDWLNTVDIRTPGVGSVLPSATETPARGPCTDNAARALRTPATKRALHNTYRFKTTRAARSRGPSALSEAPEPPGRGPGAGLEELRSVVGCPHHRR
jgi:hypothetical protein